VIAAAAMAGHLPGVLRHFEPFLDSYGYLAVAGFVMLEDFGVPVPGETILVLGAVYAGAGRLSLPLVAALGFLAAVVGDNIGFAIGHVGGRPLAERYGRYVFLTPARLGRATELFARHGGKIIIVARFIEGLRQVNGIIAGTVKVPWRRFLLLNAIGAALWVAVWTAVGYLSGSHIDTIYGYATRYDAYFAITVAVGVAVYVTWRVRRARLHRAPDAGANR
jgi:membrane protein DedA with SNARE-associated domain